LPVSINNQWSARYTVVEVTGLDRPGLLYELTTALSKLKLNIASAYVASASSTCSTSPT
jgi:[protein-PII] uridylyltransferase